MTYSYTVNQGVGSQGEALWLFKEKLVAAGWDVAASGDGTGANYNAAGDVHAPGGPYAGTLDLTDAWMRLRAPVAMTPRREFVIKKVSVTIGRWGILYSGEDGFTGGAPDATTHPTATDGEGVYNLPGSITGQWLSTGDAGHFYDMVVGDVSENFSFFIGARIRGDRGYDSMLALDVLDQAHAADPDPAILMCGYSGDGLWPMVESHGTLSRDSTANLVQSNTLGWYDKNGGEAFVLYPPCRLSAELGFLGTMDGTAQKTSGVPNGNFQELPILYWRGGDRFATQRGRKGASHLFRNVNDALGFLRPNLTFTRMAVGYLSIPWDGASKPRYA